MCDSDCSGNSASSVYVVPAYDEDEVVAMKDENDDEGNEENSDNEKVVRVAEPHEYEKNSETEENNKH